MKKWAFGEVQICLILAIRAIFERILHWNRKEAFYGVFRFDRIIWKGNGARFGLIFPQNTYPQIPDVSDEG